MIIMFFILLTNIYSQDIEPVSMSFTYNSEGINIEQERFQQQNFFLGWQWGGHKKMINAMGTNLVVGGGFGKYFEWESYETKSSIFGQPGKYGTASQFPFIQAAAWLQFEPGLKIPENKEFITIYDDPSNPVFGFEFITEYGTLTFTNDSDDDDKKHYRLALYEDNFSSSTESEVLVLSNPWPGDKFITIQTSGANSYFSGRKWNLTLNLRRSSTSFNGYSSTLSDDTPVLSIILPYNYSYLGSNTLTGGEGSEQIKFFELPETDLSNISDWYSAFIFNRPIGHYIPLQPASTITPISRTLTVTKKMIPNWLDQFGEPVDINIVATYLTSNTFNYDAVFDDEVNKFHNPKYTSNEINNDITPYITKQNIEVYYHKTLDIAIDWIRISNDTGHDLLTGKFETGTGSVTYNPYGWEGNSPTDHYSYIQPAIQGFLNTISSSSYTLPNNDQKYELFRFLIADSESENPIWWGMLRYANLITNGLALTRDQGYYYPKRYYHYTKCANRYLGINQYHNETALNAPYLYNESNIDRDNGKTISGGYNLDGFNIERILSSLNTQTPDDVKDIDFGPGWGGFRSPYDTLNSDYETGNSTTFVYNLSKQRRNTATGTQYGTNQEFLDEATEFETNNLLKWEWTVNKFLYKSDDIIYNTKNWWMNYFISFNIKTHEFTSPSNTFKENYPDPFSNEEVVNINTQSGSGVMVEFLRPKTSEEVRRLIGTSIILGAKGIMFDKDHYYTSLSGTINQNLSTHSSIFTSISYPDAPSSTFSPSDDWGFIKQTEIGGDFTNPSNSGTYSGDVYHVNLFVDPEVVERQYKVKEDRLYLGHKSTRTEMKKQFEWIKLNDDELMNLDLISWYTRSFFVWQSNHPYWGSGKTHSYGSKYFKLDEIRTRKLYQPSVTFTHNYDPPIEDKDSAFFDITILKSKETPLHLMNNSNTFYVGVQNRRTDPLFLNNKESTTFQSVQFYSGAEFDDKVLNGGYDLYDQYHSSTWWEARWWERFGARELIMPINLKPYGYGKFITFTDLGYDKYDDDPDNWFLTDPYNHVIDTILNHSNSLRVKLLPGQFKIIKAVQKTVLSDDEDCYTCDLVDDFDAFNLELKPVGTSPNCCWDVNFIVDYTKLPPDKLGCTFTDVPIKITLDGDDYQTLNPTFSGATYTTDVSSKSIYLSKTFSGSGTFTMGQLCYTTMPPSLPPAPPNLRKTRVSVLFGKDTLDSFIGCNRRIFDDVFCENGEEEEVESCCDKLGDVSSTFTSGLSELECCTTITIDTDTDSECIYNVALELSKNYWYDLTNNNNSITFSDLPLHNSNYLIGEYCTPYTSGHDCDEVSEIQRDLLFLGADGEIICRKPVTIYACCENIGGPSGGDVTQGPKVSFEVDSKDEPFISLEKESVDVKVIPNPNTGVFRIELTNKLEGQYEINIHDALGNKIIGFSPEIYDVGIFVKYVNIQNYPNGAYFINIRGNKENITIPVVISK